MIDHKNIIRGTLHRNRPFKQMNKSNAPKPTSLLKLQNKKTSSDRDQIAPNLYLIQRRSVDEKVSPRIELNMK